MPPLWPYDTEHGGFLKHKSAFKSRTGSVGLSSKLKVQKIIWSDKNYILWLASHQNTALVIVYCVPRVPKQHPQVLQTIGMTHQAWMWTESEINVIHTCHFGPLPLKGFLPHAGHSRLAFTPHSQPSFRHLHWVCRSKWHFLSCELSLNDWCPRTPLSVLSRTQ